MPSYRHNQGEGERGRIRREGSAVQFAGIPSGSFCAIFSYAFLVLIALQLAANYLDVQHKISELRLIKEGLQDSLKRAEDQEKKNKEEESKAVENMVRLQQEKVSKIGGKTS